MNYYFCENLVSTTLTKEPITLNGSFSLNDGDYLAIVGGDGLLRSNYLYLLSGLLNIDSGVLKIFSKDLKNIDYTTLKKLRTKLAFVFDEGGLISNISISDNMVLPLRYHYKVFSNKYLYKRVERYLKYFNIYEYKDARPGAVDKEIYKLSLYCRAFILNPKLVFINEPMLFLGTKYKKYILDYLFRLRYHNKKILVSSFSDVELAFSMANKFLILEQKGFYTFCESKEAIFDSVVKDNYIRELFKGAGVN